MSPCPSTTGWKVSAASGGAQCTHQYKLKPLRWAYRELLGKGRKSKLKPGAIEAWIGISTDEAMRMKPSDVAWLRHRWPLIERRMNRQDCKAWLERHGFPIPPKSSCIGCPYHNDAYWRDMRDHAPGEWQDAVYVDRVIRARGTSDRLEQYMHPSLKPLDQADLSTLEDHGQLDLFTNDCEGMCGV